MRIVKIRVQNFRCIATADIFPSTHNVLLGPNNEGKTTILEALNLILNPEFSYRSNIIDENDFHRRQYRVIPDDCPESEGQNRDSDDEEKAVESTHTEVTYAAGDDPFNIYLEAIISELSDEDKDVFGDHLIAWNADLQAVVESTEEGEDPFEKAVPAIRVFFEGWYDPDEDDFAYDTYFLSSQGAIREDCRRFNRNHKRHIGFLIYRNFRALTRPITLEPNTLFGLLLASQESTPKNFENVLEQMEGVLQPIVNESEFSEVLNSYRSELERFLPFDYHDPSDATFELTDRTRREIKGIAQLYVETQIGLPLQKMGAGTRSLAILAILTLIMRRRGRGILALEEPETFLFPHAQRRVIDESIMLADQLFITTHSPYVLERIPVDGVGRVARNTEDEVSWTQISLDKVKDINLYSKRFKQVHCEALVGKAVVVVEGDSDRAWLIGASRSLNGESWRGRKQEAFELLGVGVVSSEGHGDISKLGEFFHSAGLIVIGLYDRLEDEAVVHNICQCPFLSLFLPFEGLEDLLSTSLPTNKLKVLLTSAPHCKTPLKSADEVATMSDDDIRRSAKALLVENKGSIQMHEWLISQTESTAFPAVLKNIVSEVSAVVKSGLRLSTHTVLNCG